VLPTHFIPLGESFKFSTKMSELMMKTNVKNLACACGPVMNKRDPTVFNGKIQLCLPNLGFMD
jgi:hypothetical protein